MQVSLPFTILPYHSFTTTLGREVLDTDFYLEEIQEIEELIEKHVWFMKNKVIVYKFRLKVLKDGSPARIDEEMKSQEIEMAELDAKLDLYYRHLKEVEAEKRKELDRFAKTGALHKSITRELGEWPSRLRHQV